LSQPWLGRIRISIFGWVSVVLTKFLDESGITTCPAGGRHPLPVGMWVGIKEGMPVVSGCRTFYFDEEVDEGAFSDW
jgi:hypothetical protein